MVVCKCRKATKLYCFVHKAPVCGECICFPEHQICVVRTYSEWVIDGEYDWPHKCCSCQTVLEEGTGPQTARLGCLHVTHTSCFVSHIQSFPPHTAPAGYVCPACSTPIWPPKTIKDSGSRLHHMLKEAIMQTGMEKNLFGNYPVSMGEARGPSAPPADKSVNPSSAGGRESNEISLSSTLEDGVKNIGGYAATSSMGPRFSESEIVEIDVPGSADNFVKSSSPVGPGATARKSAFQVDRNSDISYYADDEDSYRKKYSRRGPYHHKFLRTLLPFWSSALPTLPVTAPPRKDALNANDAPVRHHRPSRMDPRKILLVVAILGCLATMGVLYYTIAQRSLEDELPGVEQQHP